MEEGKSQGFLGKAGDGGGQSGPFRMSSIGSRARHPVGCGPRTDIGVRDRHGQHTGSVQVFLPRTTQLLINLTHGQDAIEHTLQHAAVHGDDGIPERGLRDAGPFRLQVEDIVASPEAFRTAMAGRGLGGGGGRTEISTRAK